MKRYLPFAIIGAVALLAIAGTTWLYRAKWRPAVTVSTRNAANEEGESLHVRGNKDAPVTLEEFGDFQCASCRALSDTIKQLGQDYHPQLRIIFREAPSESHPHAREAALVAEAASKQGHFWEMHDMLYREQPNWNEARDVKSLFVDYAGKLGLDVDRFKTDMAGDECAKRVDADIDLAVSFHVKTTPAILINYWSLGPSSLNPDGLRKAVDAAVNGKSLPLE
jgi:protein-disulfide isomerase